MRDYFDISGVLETNEFEIAQVACILCHYVFSKCCVYIKAEHFFLLLLLFSRYIYSV